MENVNIKADNGNALPNKKPFVDAKLDMENGIFTGAVILDEFPVEEAVRWQYRLEFSKDWNIIQSGQ